MRRRVDPHAPLFRPGLSGTISWMAYRLRSRTRSRLDLVLGRARRSAAAAEARLSGAGSRISERSAAWREDRAARADYVPEAFAYTPER